MSWHRNKKGKRPITAKEGLFFRRTNGERTSPGVETEHLVAGTLGFIGQKRKLLSVDIFFTVSRPNDSSRYSHYSVGFFCQAGALTVMLNL